MNTWLSIHIASITARDSGFFTDPSLLTLWDRGTFDPGYVHPDILQLARRHGAVMVDQPGNHLEADLKYSVQKTVI